MDKNTNFIAFSGYLGRDVEVRYTPNELAVANTSIGQGKRKKEGNERVDAGTVWIDVVLWRQLAEAHENLGKGSRVVAIGRLDMNEWVHEGQKRQRLQIVADDLVVIKAKSKNGGAVVDYDPEVPF